VMKFRNKCQKQAYGGMEKCTKPKRKGGLGIINLRSQNNALLLKHLDKFYNKIDVPLVKLI
jgi:hypothetical protein